MFNKIWDQSSSSSEPLCPFSTEKELILYVIEIYDDSKDPYSKIYDKIAPTKWKENSFYFDLRHSNPLIKPYIHCTWDLSKFKYLAHICDDEDILRALYESGHIYPSYFVPNKNLPDDIISKLCEYYRFGGLNVLKNMKRNFVKYKYIIEETKAKIDNFIVEFESRIRKEKEDKTKQKLSAFLTTAAATKMVLSGYSVDEAVNQTITSDIDDAVLDYMNQLFDK